MSTSSTSTAPTFNGSSTYASALNQALQKAVSLAQLPITQLQQEELASQSQISELNTLQTKFTSLSTALTNIGTAAGTGSFSANVSNNSVASATVGSGVLPGTYTIQVSSLGAYTNTLSDASLQKVTDPTATSISSASTLTLTVGGKDFTIQPTANTLNSLASAINNANAGVDATVVNLGSTSSPDYRLAVQSATLGDTSISLSDGGSTPLLDTITPGANASYTVNGQPTGGISSTSTNVTLAPGLTVNLLGTGTTTISVTQSPSSLQNALSSFATAYNAAVDELNTNRGQSTGALVGQSVVYSLAAALTTVTGYFGSTPGISSIADLGLTFDQTGHLQFDSTALSSLTSAQYSDISSFLGSASASTGFLGAAANTLTSLDDPTNGVIQQSISSLNDTVTGQQAEISAQQAQVTSLQTSLTNQMNSADALISSLEQQASFFTQLFSTTNALNNSNA